MKLLIPNMLGQFLRGLPRLSALPPPRFVENPLEGYGVQWVASRQWESPPRFEED